MFVGAMFKIMHWPYGQTLLNSWFLLTLIYIIIGIIHIMKNPELSLIYKIIWIVCFFFFHWITGLSYYSYLKNQK